MYIIRYKNYNNNLKDVVDEIEKRINSLEQKIDRHELCRECVGVSINESDIYVDKIILTFLKDKMGDIGLILVSEGLKDVY